VNQSILAIIPARGGSKGIPRKNLFPCAGRPLLAWTCDAALGSRRVTRAVLSTDDAEIAQVGRSAGLDVPFMRPAELAGDRTPCLSVVTHALEALRAAEGYRPDAVVLLQPTAPLRTAAHVDDALDALLAGGCDSVVSVAEIPRHFSPHWQFVVQNGCLRVFTGEPLGCLVPNRQQLAATYFRNGAIYAFWRSTLEGHGNLYGERCAAYVMPWDDSANVDDLDDIRMAERRLLARQAGSA